MRAPRTGGSVVWVGSFPAILLAGDVLFLAALAVYSSGLGVPFLFDDMPSIVRNPTIRHLWPLGAVLQPPSANGITVGGRPVLNLSLALNYAISGTNVWSYHTLNILIHVLAGLTLFGLVRRTLRLDSARAFFAVGRGRRTPPQDPESAAFGLRSEGLAKEGDAALQSNATLLAFTVALIWTVHPLQTESVTYVVQRAESLMGLFYLLTLYCFVRGAEFELSRAGATDPEPIGYQVGLPLVGRPSAMTSGPAASAGPTVPDQAADPSPKRRSWVGVGWFAAAILACLFGMATKEVMASAPVMVLLYDRTFLAGSFREAWRRRGRWYLGLAATWLLLAWLVVGNAGRGGTAGFRGGIGWTDYARTQCVAIPHYLRLTFWPHPLVFDYGDTIVHGPVTAYALLLTLLLGATAFALWRRPALGFLGAWFFLILAPTSSVVPVATQVMAEHRLYLPLAAVAVLAVIGGYAVAGSRSLLVALAAAAGLGWLAARRNADYRSELALWRSTVAADPGNPRGHSNLGMALFTSGQWPEALAEYDAALRLAPEWAEVHNNRGNVLFLTGRPEAAMADFNEALRLEPGFAKAHLNRGTLLAKLGRLSEAAADYEAALRLEPENAEARANLQRLQAMRAGAPPGRD